MKNSKYKYLFLVAFICSTVNLWAGDIVLEKFPEDGKERIIILHPTTSNIRHFNFLFEENIIDLKNCEVVGVFYKDENYNYQSAENYIEKQRIENFKLFEFNKTIHPDSIFCNNQASALFEHLFLNSKGIIFCGGPDILPAIYGERKHLTTAVSDPKRNLFELSFANHLLGGRGNKSPLLDQNEDYMVTGICLGMQTLNVGTGGSLWQDIPSLFYKHAYVEDVYESDSEIVHKSYSQSATREKGVYSGTLHHIRLKEKGRLSNMIGRVGSRFLVNSKHHQCVKKLGKGLQVEATSIDGNIVEAISHKKYPNVIGLQFHPEDSELYRKDNPYRLPGSDNEVLLADQLKKEGSYDFHLKLWNRIFSDITTNKSINLSSVN
ncbi:hypothetical protein EYV94_24945 [Puteibacter caeruleilacunae]|nr:hypothetical protein EYV94_24945 [Puteibacter caeruleilacunae]